MLGRLPGFVLCLIFGLDISFTGSILSKNLRLGTQSADMADGIDKCVGTKLEKSVGKFLDLSWPKHEALHIQNRPRRFSGGVCEIFTCGFFSDLLFLYTEVLSMRVD